MQINSSISEKIILLSEFLKNNYDEDLNEITLFDYTFEIHQLISDWLKIVNVVDVTKEMFISLYYHFNTDEINVLNKIETQNLIKIFNFAHVNQIILLEESCAKILSERKDFNVNDVDKHIVTEIIKYYDVEKLISQSPEILKCFNYNPTFLKEYESLFSPEIIYLRHKDKYSTSLKTIILDEEEITRVSITNSLSTNMSLIIKHGFEEKVFDKFDVNVVDILKSKLNEISDYMSTMDPNTIGTYEFINNEYVLRLILNKSNDLSNFTISKIFRSNLRKISMKTFSDCYNLKEIVIPNSVMEIEREAFANCYKLSKVTLPKYLQTIGTRAFKRCINLESITIPKSVTYISYECFIYCYNLSKFSSYDSTVTSYRLFEGIPLKTLTKHILTDEISIDDNYVRPIFKL